MHTCSVAEYIIVSRVSQIVRNLGYNTKLNTIVRTQDSMPQKIREAIVLMQVKLKDILEMVFPGIQFDKFANASLAFPNPFIMPVMLAQVPIGQKVYSMALVITPDNVLAVTPFKSHALMEQFQGIGSGYTYSIFPTDVISDVNVPRRNVLDELCAAYTPVLSVDSLVRPSVDEVIKNIRESLERYVLLPLGSRIDAIYDKFGSITMEEVDVISSESAMFAQIKAELFIEPIMANTKKDDIGDPLRAEEPIKNIDFMPIALGNVDDSFVFARRLTTKRKLDEKEDVKVYLKSHAPTGYNGKLPDGTYDSLIIRSDETTNYVVYLMPDTYYTYGNTISFVNESLVEVDSISIVDTYEPIRQGCESLGSNDIRHLLSDTYKIATEGLGDFIWDSSVKLLSACKNIVKSVILMCAKISSPLAKKVFNDIMSIFRTGSSQTQQYVAQYTERMLNDELDSVTDLLGQWFQLGLKSLIGATTIALLSQAVAAAFAAFILCWMVFKKFDNKRRRNAIKMVELRVVSQLETLNDKIKAAQLENNIDAVEELRKEKFLYDRALSELVRLRTERYNGSLLDRLFSPKQQAHTVKSIQDGGDPKLGVTY